MSETKRQREKDEEAIVTPTQEQIEAAGVWLIREFGQDVPEWAEHLATLLATREAAAFVRGQESMRERCISKCEEESSVPKEYRTVFGDGFAAACERCATAIRALPTVEE